MSERTELLYALATRALRRGRVLLSSGKESDYYLDCRLITLDPYYARMAGRSLLRAYRSVSSDPIQGIAGPSVGADPLVMSMIFAALDDGGRIHGLLVRKEAKGHGTGEVVEGAANLHAGARVLLVEDVVTTGRSLLHAAQALKQAGFEIGHAVALVEREEGGRQALGEFGVELIALFKAADILKVAGADNGWESA